MPIALDLGLRVGSRFYPRASDGFAALGRELNEAEKRLPAKLRDELRKHLQLISQQLAAKHSGAYPGGTSSNSLSSRSGNLVRSLKEGMRVSGTSIANITATITGTSYMFIHEYGGTLRPTRAQYLTIPLPAALNPDGTPKYVSARQWNNTFVGESKRGNLLVFQRRGRNIVPLYVLKKEVKIAARLGMREAISSGLDAYMLSLVDELWKDVMR